MNLPAKTITYRPFDLHSSQELEFVADKDSRIPLEFDPQYRWTNANVTHRLEFYKKLKSEDFFNVALFENQIVAFHAANISSYPPDLKVAMISTLWVDPEFRKLGIARELKKQAEAWARSHGLAFIQTNVHRDNQKMLSLNESLEFETCYFTMRKRL